MYDFDKKVVCKNYEQIKLVVKTALLAIINKKCEYFSSSD